MTKHATVEISREKGIELAKSKWWVGKTAKEIVQFQLFTDTLCMDFGDFQKAVQDAMGRPVWTHEFAEPDLLRDEFLGTRKAPTMEEIIEMIPAEKRVIVIGG